VNTPHKKNQTALLVIFALSVIPFGFAWYLAKNPENLTLGKSKGDLLTPPITTELTDFKGYDDFTAVNLKELQGHWVLINLVPQSVCNAVCDEALYKTRQINLMIGKDISRVRRAAVLFVNSGDAAFNGEWRADGHLLKVLPARPLLDKLNQTLGAPVADGMLLIMDPLGNLMMKYPPGYDPYKVKSDLDKLLRISQIG
jgi:hypothetical protein